MVHSDSTAPAQLFWDRYVGADRLTCDVDTLALALITERSRRVASGKVSVDMMSNGASTASSWGPHQRCMYGAVKFVANLIRSVVGKGASPSSLWRSCIETKVEWSANTRRPIVFTEVTRSRFEQMLTRFGPPHACIQKMSSVCTRNGQERLPLYRPWFDNSAAEKVLAVGATGSLQHFRESEERAADKDVLSFFKQQMNLNPTFKKNPQQLMVALVRHSTVSTRHFVLASGVIEPSNNKLLIRQQRFCNDPRGYYLNDNPGVVYPTISDLVLAVSQTKSKLALVLYRLQLGAK
jgi:hypothetical protein